MDIISERKKRVKNALGLQIGDHVRKLLYMLFVVVGSNYKMISVSDTIIY